jgi:hypothetical protein
VVTVMTHAALAPLIGPEFDQFLGASIGEDRNGTGLSVLSALARLDVDPWQEAASLARMSGEAATGRLTALIDALPYEPTSAVPSKAIAADLVALLPKTKKVNVSSPDNVLAVVGARQAQIRIALCALAVLIAAVVLTLSANRSLGGVSADPSAPAAADVTRATPRRPGP